MAITPRQLEAVAALLTEGDMTNAAFALGISLPSQRDRLRRARQMVGVETTARLVYELAHSGELTIPDRVPVERPRRPNGGYHGARSGALPFRL